VYGEVLKFSHLSRVTSKMIGSGDSLEVRKAYEIWVRAWSRKTRACRELNA
jgi:hypothetical protein